MNPAQEKSCNFLDGDGGDHYDGGLAQGDDVGAGGDLQDPEDHHDADGQPGSSLNPRGQHCESQMTTGTMANMKLSKVGCRAHSDIQFILMIVSNLLTLTSRLRQ